MAGLEVLFAAVAPTITCAQDALVCFLHWEVVTHGYYGLGASDQVRHGAGRGRGGRIRFVRPKTGGPQAWPRAPDLTPFESGPWGP